MEPPWKVKVVVKNENEVEVKREAEEDWTQPWVTVKREREAESGEDDHEDWVHIPRDSRHAKQPKMNPSQEEPGPTPPDDNAEPSRETPENTNQDEGEDNPWAHLLRVKNYAAVDASFGNFGLIPMGVENGVRSLIVHVPRGKASWVVFHNIRPGGTIRVVLTSNVPRRKKNEPKTLNVRYTTPTKYFPPGAKTSCLTIGVDDAEWQSLMRKPRRI